MNESPSTLRILAISQDFSSRNPSGAALARLLNRLAEKHEITCLGGSPQPAEMPRSIQYVRVWRLNGCGVLAALISFHVFHLLAWLWLRIVKREQFDVVQTVDSESLVGTVVTFHCCHAAYVEVMRRHGLFQLPGLRGWLASLYTRTIYGLRIAVERYVTRSRRTATLIALSQGSAEDIVRCYRPRVVPVVIPNSVVCDL